MLVRASTSKRRDSLTGLLEQGPFCAYDLDLPLFRAWCGAIGLNVLRHAPTLVVPDLRALAHFVGTGAALSVLPDYIVAPGLAGRLQRIAPVRI